jgi:hypothetical protein
MATMKSALKSIGRGLAATGRAMGEAAVRLAEHQAAVSKRKAERAVGNDGLQLCLIDALQMAKARRYNGPQEEEVHRALIAYLGDYLPPEASQA